MVLLTNVFTRFALPMPGPSLLQRLLSLGGKLYFPIHPVLLFPLLAKSGEAIATSFIITDARAGLSQIGCCRRARSCNQRRCCDGS